MSPKSERELKQNQDQCLPRVIVAAVSYLNTVPFIWGISRAATQLRESLVLAVPSECARLLNENIADIALIPIAAIPENPNAKIVTDFCISAEGYVLTVALLSTTTLDKISKIYLDADSRTSVELAKILARDSWKIEPQWIEKYPANLILKKGEAIVAIGDKVFDLQKKFRYKYDLAHEWQKMTGLPFVFAAWVTTKQLDPRILKQLNEALELGTQNVTKALEDYPTTLPNPEKYLTQNIKYNLTPTKRKAIELFWEKMASPPPL